MRFYHQFHRHQKLAYVSINRHHEVLTSVPQQGTIKEKTSSPKANKHTKRQYEPRSITTAADDGSISLI
jgi:hypothetical protein